MKSQQRTTGSPGLVLRFPCPLAELEDILRKVDLSQVREHVDRLRQQFELAQRVLTERTNEKQARQQAEQKRLEAWFASMPTAELEKYIAERKPNCRMARRTLNRRIQFHRRQAKAAAAAEAPLSLPCDGRTADRDWWRIQGG